MCTYYCVTKIYNIFLSLCKQAPHVFDRRNGYFTGPVGNSEWNVEIHSPSGLLMKLVTLEIKMKLNETWKVKKTQGTVEMLLLALLPYPFLSWRKSDYNLMIYKFQKEIHHNDHLYPSLCVCRRSFTCTCCFRDKNWGQEWGIRDICGGGTCSPKHDRA